MTDVINLDKADEKNATLNLHLKAKSGFNSKSSYSVSSNEWGAVIGLLEGTRKAVTIEHFNALAGIENPAAFVQAARVLHRALEGVIDATASYLPPDGISKDDCINRVLAASDNADVFHALRAFRAATGGA